LVGFPVPVRVGMPPDLGGDVLRTQIVDGTIYWVATQEFPAKRIEVQATGSGNIYLLDLSASKSATVTAPVEISVPEAKLDVASPAKAGIAPVQAVPPPPPKEQDYATLTRMASQHLYAPARLHRVPEGVHQAGVAKTGTDRLLRGGVAEATPVGAWRSGSLYVTAVKLRNLTDEEVVLDPRRMRGHWITCAFQHGSLSPRGDLRDTTSAYLISAKPYGESLDGG
jgi:integrating conjugative element protein (TIGR03749 family)